MIALANTIGKQIKKFRTQLSLTQAELAARVGVSQVMITAYENGYRTPSVQVLSAIAEALSCTVDEIIKE